jgi:hypothetical protein
MVLALDSDALIKLNRGGVLEQVARVYRCAIPEAVYHEVVTQGKARGYSDVDAIERVVQELMDVHPTGLGPRLEAGLGAGENAILALMHTSLDMVIVSDDARFLGWLKQHSHRQAIIPADLVVVLAHQEHLTRDEAREALERMRPTIPQTIYHQAMQDLEARE